MDRHINFKEKQYVNLEDKKGHRGILTGVTKLTWKAYPRSFFIETNNAFLWLDRPVKVSFSRYL